MYGLLTLYAWYCIYFENDSKCIHERLIENESLIVSLLVLFTRDLCSDAIAFVERVQLLAKGLILGVLMKKVKYLVLEIEELQ